MRTTRLGLFFFACLLSACAIAPFEPEANDAEFEAASWEISPGKEEASAVEHEPSAAPETPSANEKRLEFDRAHFVTEPTPDPWNEASPPFDPNAGPTPDPWQPKHEGGNKGSGPSDGAASGQSKN